MGHTAPAQCCNECQQRNAATPNDGEVHLHLLTGFGFKASDGIVCLGFQGQQKAGEDGVSALLTLFAVLPQQHDRRNPMVSSGFYVLAQIGPERHKLAHALRARAIGDGAGAGPVN